MMTRSVVKRSGEQRPMAFDKIFNRILFMAKGEERDGTVVGPALVNVSVDLVAQNVVAQLTDGVRTSELDEYAAKYCASLCSKEHEYAQLGGRIAVSNHQKNHPQSFSATVKALYENVNTERGGEAAPLVHRTFVEYVGANAAELDAMVDPLRDFRLDYFGIETLKKAYLLRTSDGKVCETPQHLYLRVAVALSLGHGSGLDNVRATYNAMSLGRYSHATPTMFNAGTLHEQLSSCFLLGIGDSMVDDGGIPDCWKACARISKVAGGIGIGATPIRGAGTHIAGTGGKSDGIVPLSRVFNDIARYVNQGGRRPGSIKLTLEPWHPDIFDFLDLKKNIGVEELRSRDLTYALWVPDLFMRRLEQAVKSNTPVMWSLMCPHKCPGLYDSYGEEFEARYLQYEASGKFNRQVDVMHLWREILTSQKETGGPDILFKDAVNRKNNQKNLGVIRNSNLCSEILEYSDESQYAVCNLASISLAAFVADGAGFGFGFDFAALMDTCRLAHRNLDRVIDINFYPHVKCRWSNVHHRPVGLGTQGWADTLLKLGLPFEDTDETTGKATINPDARKLNRVIAECMYYACLTESCTLARERASRIQPLVEAYKAGKLRFKPNPRGMDREEVDGIDVDVTALQRDAPELEELCRELLPVEAELNRESHYGAYASFLGSPASLGQLQFDMWDVKPITDERNPEDALGVVLDWEALRAGIQAYGLRNSLVRADMPTATTAQILGNSECTEPYKYVLYTRRVMAGEFVVVNPFLHQQLRDLGLDSEAVMKEVVRDRGSLQKVTAIPHKVKDLYRTAFEISKKTVQLMAADRGAFIDQTQSMNYFVPRPNNKLMTNILVGAWKLGLKTGMYYLRREPVENPVQFTVAKDGTVGDGPNASEPEECVACSA